MNAAAIPNESWPLRRWTIAVCLAAIIQTAAIFWLSEKPAPRVQSPASETSIYYPEHPSREWLSLSDPTLFGLPNRQNFSGLAWLRIPRQELPVLEWSEPTNWLALSTADLGKTWSKTGGNDASSILRNVMDTEPAMNIPVPVPVSFPSESTFHLEDSSGQKISLLQPIRLRSWPGAEILSNTVVRAMVNAEGIPNSVALLAKSGSPEADRYALEQASRARFTPDEGAKPRGPLGSFRWVTIVFEWHTNLTVGTNTPAARVAP